GDARRRRPRGRATGAHAGRQCAALAGRHQSGDPAHAARARRDRPRGSRCAGTRRAQQRGRQRGAARDAREAQAGISRRVSVMAKLRVVITGAAGYVAQRMFKVLDERWGVVPIDITDKNRGGQALPRLVASDLTQPDRNSYRQPFRGADAVIHCGFVRAPGMTADTWQDNSDAKFQAEHTNVALAYNVYRVALEEGVRRVVVCSSNHASDYYERL